MMLSNRAWVRRSLRSCDLPKSVASSPHLTRHINNAAFGDMSADDDARSETDTRSKGSIIPTLPFLDGRDNTLAYRCFHDERTDLPGLTALIQEELSEP